MPHKSKAEYNAYMRKYMKTYNRVRNRYSLCLTQSRVMASANGYLPCSATIAELKSAFTGYCKVCNHKETAIKLHMDHDHTTGRFRGWLCRKCNHTLGFAHDSPERLDALACYLRGGL